MVYVGVQKDSSYERITVLGSGIKYESIVPKRIDSLSDLSNLIKYQLNFCKDRLEVLVYEVIC